MPTNFKFTYQRKGKHIFVPNQDCIRRGKVLIRHCSKTVRFPKYFFHYQSGGHVEALHRHLENKFFFRIDLENFFYSISRNRVAAALHNIGFTNARTYAQWSCVKNPVGGPPYSLPIGFVQSPVLASLAILRSPLAAAIQRANENGVFISVYFDDFIGSAIKQDVLMTAFQDILAACKAANLVSNALKLEEPSEHIVAFNCNLSHGLTEVTGARVGQFFEIPRNEHAIEAFEEYCDRVARENYPEQ